MFTIIGLSIPDFVLGTVFLLFLVAQFEWIPPITYARLVEDPWGNFQQFIFPAILLGFGLSASIARMTRSTMLEVLRQDYIRTAWSKGLRGRTVVLRHALRNSMIPVITIIGVQFGALLGGTVVMEVLFGMPGLGRTMVEAINQRDYPFMQAIVLVSALAYVVVNLAVDLSYGFLDPRIRYG
jgi:peptide/nickel transport system permease protein